MAIPFRSVNDIGLNRLYLELVQQVMSLMEISVDSQGVGAVVVLEELRTARILKVDAFCRGLSEA